MTCFLYICSLKKNSLMADGESECWYVSRTRRGQEFVLRERLDKFGIRNFVPVHRIMKVRSGKRFEVTVPLISGMVFLKTTKSIACALANGHGLPLFYVIDRSTNRMLVVPDKQMDDFIRVVNDGSDDVKLEDFVPYRGQKVKIVKGNLAGVEGEVLFADNDSYLVVSIESLLSAKVKVPTDCLEPVG